MEVWRKLAIGRIEEKIEKMQNLEEIDTISVWSCPVCSHMLETYDISPNYSIDENLCCGYVINPIKYCPAWDSCVKFVTTTDLYEFNPQENAKQCIETLIKLKEELSMENNQWD